MALNLITLEDAARILGVTPDELTEMRERREVHAYRDGANWKFKQQDIERVKQEREEEVSGGGDSEDDMFDVVLLSERELGESDPGTSSTVIGKPGQLDPAESDIRIYTAGDSSAGASGIKEGGLKQTPKPGSDAKKAVPPAPPVAKGRDTNDLDLPIGDESSEELSLELLDSGVNLSTPGAKGGGPGSDVSLSFDDVSGGADPLELEEDSSFEFDDDGASGDVLELDSDDDVLAPRAGKSDVTRGGDSGISLASPSDSGLSLEGPLKLGPGASGKSDDAFELADAGSLSLEEESDSAEVDGLGEEDDFLLTPLEEVADPDSEGSGSQVIDLDSQEAMEPAAGSLLEEGSMSDMLAEGFADSGDLGGFSDGGLSGLEEDSSVGAAPMGAAAPSPFAARESQYTMLNVVSLGICVLFLLVSGMMTFDLLRNMWSWQGPFAVNSPLMDLIGNLF
jgi:hypothetical protein